MTIHTGREMTSTKHTTANVLAVVSPVVGDIAIATNAAPNATLRTSGQKSKPTQTAAIARDANATKVAG